MDIILDDIGKRYTTGWVFKNISHHLTQGQHLSITGTNGSGKSTLLQIIAGFLSYTKGEVTYKHEGKEISRDNIYKYCGISAAYTELDEELTVTEIFEHYKVFKKMLVTNSNAFLDLVDLKKEKNKRIAQFSSGMKQRLNLGLALVMDTPLLLLDEPTSFLDKGRKAWYAEMVQAYALNKILVIASNDDFDIQTCTANIFLDVAR